MKGRVWNIFENLAIIPAIATFYIFDTKIISIRSTSGKSMLPTVNENSILIVDRIFYKLLGNEIKKDDVVVASQPVDPKVHICKRVVEVGGNRLPQYSNILVP